MAVAINPALAGKPPLEAQFAGLLDRLHFDEEVLKWVREALWMSHADERCEHEDAIKRRQATSAWER